MGGLRPIECYNKINSSAESKSRTLSKNEFKIQMAIKTGWAQIPNIPLRVPPPIEYHRSPPRRTADEANAVAALLRYLQEPHDSLMLCQPQQPKKRRPESTSKEAPDKPDATQLTLESSRSTEQAADDQGPSAQKKRRDS